MGKIFNEITPDLVGWLQSQPLFFIGTAPLDPRGHLNISPKGMDSFRVLGNLRVGYLDLTGSGAETIAHVRENGRIVLMFCAFSGPPKIVRLHGQARVVTRNSPEWETWQKDFPGHTSARSIILVEVDRVSDSCGYGVPEMEHKVDRDTLLRWGEKKGPAGLAEYRAQKNARSIDGLPALEEGEY